MSQKKKKSDADWKRVLTTDQYSVTREHGTERAFSHPYNNEKSQGVYHCICCNAALFDSDDKFDSGSGWPSFTRPYGKTSVTEHEDRSLFMRRTEIRCSECEAHLGHVFPDGPQPTGLRYCINGVALAFQQEDDSRETE